MASITFWNRLEPRPRSNSIRESLAARIRDPLWLLTRQWQMGEFRGADAGSPAWVEYAGAAARLTGWRPAPAPGAPAAPFTPIPPAAPLERTLLAEPFAPDRALAVELGQRFETRLSRAGGAAAIPAFRARYPISAAGVDPLDEATLRFVAVCAGRALDGLALATDARASAPAVPPGVT